MAETVIVATDRAPIGKPYRGAFNDTRGQALARSQTRLEDFAALKWVLKAGRQVREGAYITAGNASQLSPTRRSIAAATPESPMTSGASPAEPSRSATPAARPARG